MGFNFFLPWWWQQAGAWSPSRTLFGFAYGLEVWEYGWCWPKEKRVQNFQSNSQYMEKRDMGKMQWVITFGHFCSSPPPITTKDTKFRIWEFLRVTDCYMCILNISYQLLQKHNKFTACVFRYSNDNFPFHYNIAILLEKGRNKWFKMTHFSK